MYDCFYDCPGTSVHVRVGSEGEERKNLQSQKHVKVIEWGLDKRGLRSGSILDRHPGFFNLYCRGYTEGYTLQRAIYIYTPLSRLPDKFYALKCLWHMKPTFTLLTVPYLKITAVVATVYAFI